MEVLREKLDLTGTKKGVTRANVGHMLFFLDGKPINSCLTLAVRIERERSIMTIEGVTGKKALILQETFNEKGAIQCGFCTPGMVLTTKALLAENSNPTSAEIKEAISEIFVVAADILKLLKRSSRLLKSRR